MISENPRPFLFVHIPKNAGTSMEQALFRYLTPYRSFEAIPQTIKDAMWLPPFRQHHKLVEYQEQLQDIERFFKWSFVRNPWSRAVSQTMYLRQKAGIFEGETFKHSLRRYVDHADYVRKQDLAANQIDYLVDSSGVLAVDFIGKVEHLDSHWKELCVELGLPAVLPLGHVFRDNTSDYRHYFDDESREWIAQKYSRDIEAFQYEF